MRLINNFAKIGPPKYTLFCVSMLEIFMFELILNDQKSIYTYIHQGKTFFFQLNQDIHIKLSVALEFDELFNSATSMVGWKKYVFFSSMALPIPKIIHQT